ncbi:hypothetical protein Tco_0619206 [Tanacetum coccineum]
MSKMLYTRFTKLIIDYRLLLNKSIPCRLDSKLHSSQDDHPITKLVNITNGEYKFGMELPDAMISDAIKKKAGYKYYMPKKVESKKAKIVDKPKKQHVSLIKYGRGKGFMCYGNQVANVPNKLKKHVLPRKTRSFTIAKEAVIGSKDSRLERLRKKKQPVAREGSSAAHNKYYSSSDTTSDATFYSSSLDESKESANETDDVDEFDMDLSHDNLRGDDDDARKFNFKKAVTQKFKEYDQKLVALTNFNVSKAFEKAIQAKVLTEIKKLLPTHIPNAIATYVKPCFNTSVLEVMKTNQINLFTQLSTSTDDLSKMELKIKLLNRIHLNKLNDTHITHQQLYDTLYEYIILDQDALDAQAT